MRTILLLILLLQGASLTLEWRGDSLRIERSAGCLYLVGGGLEPKWLDVPCDASPVVLRAAGIDYLDAPLGRTVELREPVTGKRISAVPVPARYRVILPVVVHPHPVDG